MKSKAILVAAVLMCFAMPEAKADSFTAFITCLNFPIPCTSIGTLNSPGPLSFRSRNVASNPIPPTQGGGIVTSDAQGLVSASPGQLGGFSQAAFDIIGGFLFNERIVSIGGESDFTITGITLLGPPGTEGQIVPMSLNVVLSGNFEAVATTCTPLFNSSLGAFAGGSVNTSVGGGGFSLGSLLAGCGGSVTSSGIFPMGTATSPTFLARVGETDISISLSLGTNAGAHGSEPGSALAFVDYSGGTLGFPTSGPVFNLPAGFTVNSADGAIVNNQFVPAVPEPSTLLLLGSGIVAILGFRRRQRT